MPKTYAGGTVDVAIAQRFRVNARKFYSDNFSVALEAAMAMFNDKVEHGEIPRIKRVTDIRTALEYEKKAKS